MEIGRKIRIPHTIDHTYQNIGIWENHEYDVTGYKYKSIVYTNLSTTMTPYYSIAHYPLDADTIWYNITEYAGNIENHYSCIDTTQRIFNSIGYYTDSVYYHYIKDHIGNICAVVNSAADTLIQSTIYYPSGVPMAQNLGPNVAPSYYNALGLQYTKNFGRDEQPYLYNGKEFIEAHGLNEYDSDARMYYATIMRTTTMDPLAEKYYHISPYAWCGNNPVKVIDPLGRDTFNIQSDNNVTAISSEGQDVVRFVDKKGNVRMVNGDVLEKSFGPNGTIRLVEYKESKENQQGYIIFSVDGDKAGTELFEFLATSGAQKEWSHLKTGNDESGTNYIGTDWEREKTTIAYRIKTQYLTPKFDILREQIHNHPIGGILLPSGTSGKLVNGVWMDAGTWGDMGTKNETIKKWGNSVIFKIYGLDVNTGEYIYVTY